jgi:hypothetical protein
MVKNKRGWMKIVEATLAVLIISGVLIAVYSSQPKQGDFSKEVANFQKQILMDFSSQTNLRLNVLNSDDPADYLELKNYVANKIPSYLNFSLKICDLTDPPQPCKNDDYVNTIDKNVYVDEIIISAEIGQYEPKKVRLFVWEK